MSSRHLSPGRFTALAAISWLFLFLIVLTGAAVRLTDSGLGCEEWPTCDKDTIIEAWTFHRSVEFGNRLISGFVGLVCVATAIAAHFRRPYRRDLVRWAWAIAAGVGVQGIIGRYSVTTHLHPLVVAVHFLGSPVLLWMVIVLWVRARKGPYALTDAPTSAPIGHFRLLGVLAVLVLAVGTLVTGTGPNGGDTRADRLDLDFVWISRIHSIAAWLFLAALVTLIVRMMSGQHTSTAPRGTLRLLWWTAAVSIAQGAVGYYQYANGVPRAAVQLHILGATTLWCLVVLAYLSLFDPGRQTDPASNESN